jgi:organic radical activating enzyme
VTRALDLGVTPSGRISRLPFVEGFGPTLQGEGPAAGRAASFIRFGNCNLSCTWCDSPYTWDTSRFSLKDEITQLTPAECLERVPEAPIVVVTGGEPLMSQRKPAWGVFLAGLKARGAQVHIETNGTILPNEVTLRYVDVFIVSPKQGHAGAHKGNQNPALHTGWAELHDAHECHLKVVVEDAAGVAAAVDQADNHHWPRHKVWVMPEGTTAAVLAARFPEVATAAAEHRINASHRLHVLAWTDVRGH